MPNKMERFTQRARRVLSLAQEEAERLQHNYIGTEHLLLGLMREEGGIAGRVLHDLGVDYDLAVQAVNRSTKASMSVEDATFDLSPDTKRALELAVDEARRMGHRYIDTGHLLLGVVRNQNVTAVEVLKSFNVSPDAVRRQIRQVLQKEPQQDTQDAANAQRESFETDMLTILRLRIQASILSQLLSKLTEVEAGEELSALLDVALSDQSITLNEPLRTRLLDSIKEAFKPAETIPQLRVRITDKATGQVIVEMRMSLLDEPRGSLKHFVEILTSPPSGKTILLDDDQWHIELSIDGEPQAGTPE